jgi:hypothetical protein
MKRAVGLAIVLASSAALLPTPAWATAGENEWRAGLGTSFSPWALAGLELGWLHDLTDFWGAGATLRDRRSLRSLPDGTAAISADVRFVVDALQWIPALGMGFGAAVGNDGRGGSNGVEMLPYLRFEASLAYRPARTWGVVLHVGADHYGGQDGSFVGTVSLSYQMYTGNGSGLDL